MTEAICEYDTFLRWLIGAFAAGFLAGGIFGILIALHEARRLIRQAQTDGLADYTAKLRKLTDTAVRSCRPGHLDN